MLTESSDHNTAILKEMLMNIKYFAQYEFLMTKMQPSILIEHLWINLGHRVQPVLLRLQPEVAVRLDQDRLHRARNRQVC